MVHWPLGPKIILRYPCSRPFRNQSGPAVAAEQLGLAHQPASFNLQFNVFFSWLAASWRTKTKSWRRPTSVLNIKHCLRSVGKTVSSSLLKGNLLTRAES